MSDKFPWGRVIERTIIGPHDAVTKVPRYEIIHYHPYVPSVSRRQEADTSRVEYHVYVDGKDTNQGTLTFEGALLLAIAVKSLGRSHPEGLSMIARALKIGSEDGAF